MSDKKKAVGAGTPTTSNTNFDSRNYTKSNLLIGWLNLAKPSRSRQQKHRWQRGKQQGQIDAYMAGQLALLAVIAFLIASGVMP
ncbi:MAG: hypothetical protein WBB96_16525 [Candidatus Dechloromonas phosphoritropha]|jgi:hypothetical protein|nr:hypothetical protein [Candidatus Dechloromonas phosphoritropha]MBP8787174.1 hypothetical protein [Azonexus sp.]MBP9227253.1 hypothetical protein [Azonexus sp.]